MPCHMIIIKRSGARQEYDGAKLHGFIKLHVANLDPEFVDSEEFLRKIEKGMCDYMTTRDISEYCGETAATCMSIHPDFGVLASRIVVSKLHKETFPTFSEKIEVLYQNTKYISWDIYNLVMANREELDAMVDYTRDSKLSYFGVQTLKKSYLLGYQKQGGREAAGHVHAGRA